MSRAGDAKDGRREGEQEAGPGRFVGLYTTPVPTLPPSCGTPITGFMNAIMGEEKEIGAPTEIERDWCLLCPASLLQLLREPASKGYHLQDMPPKRGNKAARPCLLGFQACRVYSLLEGREVTWNVL